MSAGPRSGRSAHRHTSTSGIMPASSVIESPTIGQRNSNPVMTPRNQRGRACSDLSIKSEHGQQGHRGAGVVGEAAGDEVALSCGASMMPPPSRARARPSGPRARPWASSRQQHEQRVGHGRAHVDDPGPEAEQGLDRCVLRQFGGVEGHVRHRRVVQQQVSVQDVRRLQRVPGPVGGQRRRQDDASSRRKGSRRRPRPGPLVWPAWLRTSQLTQRPGREPAVRAHPRS